MSKFYTISYGFTKSKEALLAIIAEKDARIKELEEQQRWIPVSEFDIKEDGIYLYIDTRDQLQLSYFYAKDRRKFAHYVKQIYTMQIILPEWEEKQEGE